MFKRRKERAGGQSPEQMYNELRSMALGAAKRGSIPRHDDHPDVYGLLVDLPGQTGCATVVALGDNTTSVYTSTGGGVVGGGFRPDVAASTQRLLAMAQAHLDSFVADDDGGLPQDGMVRFHVLTGATARFADIPEDAFWGKAPHPLLPLIMAVQDVIGGLRNADPS